MAEAGRQLRQAQAALKAGDKHAARVLLQEALRAEPDNYRAWLWLAGVTPSPRASLNYVMRAEQLNPGNPTVARARVWAEKRLAEATTSPPPEQTPEPVAPAGGKPRRLGRLALGAGLLAVSLIAVAAAFLWLWPRGQDTSEAAAGVAGAAEVTPSPAGYPGFFAPRSVRDEAAQALTPTPTARRQVQVEIAAKPVTTREGGAPRPTWTVTPSPTATPSPTPTILPTFVSNNSNPQPVMRPAGVGPTERWIDVNLSTQTLVAYEGDKAVYDSLVSSGMYNHPTVTGQFRIWLRFRSQTMDGRRLGYNYYLEDVPYVMYFYEDYALHGTFWHNNFGTPMSHGCVNLPTPVAEWIFNWSELGTLVNVHY